MDRNVTVKLGVEASGNAAATLKETARAAKEAARAQDDLTAGLKRYQEESRRLSSAPVQFSAVERARAALRSPGAAAPTGGGAYGLVAEDAVAKDRARLAHYAAVGPLPSRS